MGGLGTDVNAIGLNRATNMLKQSGSSLKPIATYGCGLENGVITAGTVYDNSKASFGSWSPSSTSAKAGLCTIRDAIEVSSNVVAAKIMSEIGPDNSIDFCRKAGISTLVKASENSTRNDSNLPAMALGGLTDGVSPLEMAAAYAMVGNNGVYISPIFYTKVEDSSGNIIVEPTQTTERVMSEQNAYILKTLLKQPVEGSSGTARACKISGIDVGAKTGTTNDNYDRWLCGITPYYAGATWYGYDNSKVSISTNYAAKIWADVMKKVHEDLPSATFTEPSGIVKVTICRKSGCKASSSCTETYSEYYASGTEPSECEGHSLKICSDSGKLALDTCPNTYYYSFVPEKERNATWTSASGSYKAAPSEKCDIHAAQETPSTGTNPDEPDVSVSTDIVVPNVVGLTEAEAKKKLSSLTVVIKTKSDSTKADGVVLSQSLAPDLVVAKNTKITLTINKIEEEQEPPKNTTTNTTPSNVTENKTEGNTTKNETVDPANPNVNETVE